MQNGVHNVVNTLQNFFKHFFNDFPQNSYFYPKNSEIIPNIQQFLSRFLQKLNQQIIHKLSKNSVEKHFRKFSEFSLLFFLQIIQKYLQKLFQGLFFFKNSSENTAFNSFLYPSRIFSGNSSKHSSRNFVENMSNAQGLMLKLSKGFPKKFLPKFLHKFLRGILQTRFRVVLQKTSNTHPRIHLEFLLNFSSIFWKFLLREFFGDSSK